MNATELNKLIEDEKRICKLCKDELAAKSLNSQKEKAAFISAMLFTCGSLIIRNKKLCAAVSTKSEQTKKAVTAALQGLGVACNTELNGKTYEVVAPDCEDMLVKCKVTESGSKVVCEHIDESFYSDQAVAAAYMRGAFLGSGSLSAPEYHLEFQFRKMSIAKDFIALTARYGIKTEIATLRGKAVVYTKDSEHISDALAFMGGVKAVLSLNSIIAARQLSAHLNRQQNCDMYNLDKQINTGVKQCAYMKELDLDGLTPELRKTVEVRLEHPDYSYEQISAILGITKSGLRNRLKKLKEIYENNLNTNGEDNGNGI